MEKISVKDKLLFIRSVYDITQDKLADKLNVTQATITRWENEYLTPTKKNLLKIEMLYNQALKKENKWK